MDNSLSRSSGTRYQSPQLNQYCSKLSRVPPLTSVLLWGNIVCYHRGPLSFSFSFFYIVDALN